MENKKLINDKSILFVNKDSKMHYVKVAPNAEEYIKIWIKEPTFLQLEKAQASLFQINAKNQDVSIQMDEVFNYLWEAFVEKTEPSLSRIDLIRLTPYVGTQIKEILPDPFSMFGEDDDLKGLTETL